MLTRRSFHSSLIGGVATLSLGKRATSAAQHRNGWIDAHVHVWTPDVESYPLAADFRVADMQPPSYTPEQLFEDCHPVGVDRIVLIQMSFYGTDNRYMLDMMSRHPGVFSGVGIVDHHADGLSDTIHDLADKGVRGLRIHARGDAAASWPSDEGMIRLWRVAREVGIAVCPLINPSDLPFVERLCERFPDTEVVIDHFARIGVSGEIENDWLEKLCSLSRFSRVNVKTSAFYALGAKEEPYDDLIPMIRKVVDAFGAERLMWASDCPYQVQGDHSYEASLALIRDRIDFLSESEKQSLLRDTAERIFFST